MRRYSDHHDSGVEWPGELPDRWRVARLKFVASTNDEALTDTEDPLRPVSYVDISSVDSARGIAQMEEMVFEDAPSRARRLVRDGDTIVSTVRTYLRAIAPIADPPPTMVVSTGFAVIRPRDLDPGFSAWALRGHGFVDEVVARSVGVSYPAINAPEIGNIQVAVPPLDEQRDIAAFLERETERIDSLIAKKRLLIERLQEYRTALITRTVTRGLPPEAARAAGLDPSPRLKPSGVEWLGDVPEHWDVRPLRRLLSEPLQYGANEAAEHDDPAHPRYVRITDIDDSDSLRDETFRSLPPDVAAPYLLQEGDLLLARSGATVGKSFLYRQAWGQCAYAGYLIRARFLRHLADSRFMRYFTASDPYWQWLNSAFIQATIQNVSAERYGNLLLPVPPTEEQSSIVSFLDSQIGKIDLLEAQVNAAIERLQEYRTALIAAAVTGKIDVRDEAPVTAGLAE